MRIDPVTLEVVRAALPAVTNEMSHVLQRTSYNMMIFEIRDYCCAFVDRDGALVSQNLGGVSHFISDLGVVIQDGMRRIPTFRPGDVIVHNHQRVAGQHLNNVCVYMPFFYDGELIGFPIVRAHWIDVGGMSTGYGAADVSDPWQEGLQLNQVKVYDAGEPRSDILKLIVDNIRYPESSLGDLRAQMAACQLAIRRLEELFGKYGRETVLACIQRIYDDSEARCRQIVATMPDGEYTASSTYGRDVPGKAQRLDIHARVVISGSDMTVDLSGCSGDNASTFNSRTYAAAYIAYKAVTLPLEPVNEGSFRALRAIVPEGSFMMARYPAPMAHWSLPLPAVVDTILAALAQATPERVPAGAKGLGDAITFFGNDPRRGGKRFVAQGTEGGGWGGRPFEDGPSASVSVCQGDVRNAPIENMELKFPVVVEERKLRPDSAGPGKYRGGFGVDTRVRNLVEGRWNLVQIGGPPRPPWGLWGGEPGQPSDKLLKQPDDPDFQSVNASWREVPVGSEVIIRSAGGGGWGDPLERDPALVARDVLEATSRSTPPAPSTAWRSTRPH